MLKVWCDQLVFLTRSGEGAEQMPFETNVTFHRAKVIVMKTEPMEIAGNTA
ncbi:hypothetical protein PY650_00440 [Rhizobium calliandrae]|uniref:Uncharacterized protein n=1 Tax=Rhizobium calliandrae TaxID=1312182 RepID=A0ABT7K6A3_9HYPH|nr:hypothetical protein [Rhizobium calliandrae]MDL2404146.1 hypothetical protein [Rhizobium calliandrae]